MKLQLRDIEPFNVPPVDNDQAAAFMRHLTGSEDFEWTGAQRPRCMMVFRLEYAYPQRCAALALLFPMSVDALVTICESASGDMGDVIQRHAIGIVRVAYGGAETGVTIEATEAIPGMKTS